MIQVSTDKQRLNIGLIHEFLSKESYWAIGRDIEVVKRSIENSLALVFITMISKSDLQG